LLIQFYSRLGKLALMGSLAVREPKIGMMGIPIFNTGNQTYTIMDLFWMPKGTKEEELPEGYTSG
ncbi:MAG: hypothetical protein KAU14_09410, partial [Thermoplasmata archaeon]|nr:hypothetical protein [Thermoplasmata archaeon]